MPASSSSFKEELGGGGSPEESGAEIREIAIVTCGNGNRPGHSPKRFGRLGGGPISTPGHSRGPRGDCQVPLSNIAEEKSSETGDDAER